MKSKNKWHVVYRWCKANISETLGTTSSFSRMVSLLMFFGILTTIALTDAESHFSRTPSGIPCSESDDGLCAAGWSGCNCDMPICNPKCVGDKVCLSPNSCGCLKNGRSGSTNCPYTQCPLGERLDCYPGTCDDSGYNCTCPTQYGFTGKNCLNITSTPQIRLCTIEVRDASNQRNLLRQGYCDARRFNSSVNWINAASIGDIRATWDAWYENGPALPGNPPITYLRTAPITIGVTKASVVITLLETGQNYTTNCDGAREGITPLTVVSCDITRNWQLIGFPVPVHNQIFRVTVSAQLGGQKQVNLDGAPVQQFIGTPTTRSVAFRIDLEPPVHCLTTKAASDCQYFAIYLDQDIRTNPKIEPKFYNWTDEGSGIDKFNVKLFKMSPVSGLLERSSDPLPYSEQNITANGPDYVFIMNHESGVYSIELTVYDRAGNTARARKLFIYNKDSKLGINPNNPVYLKEANPSTNYTWLTNFENPRDGANIPLTVTWTGHFRSNSQFAGDWALAARPWGSSDGIDDKYGTRYGRRSIDPITTLQDGIDSYAVAYVLDQNGGGRGLSPPSWVILNSTIDNYKLPINQGLTDGNTIVVWVQATDVAFGTVIEKLVIGVDRTPPEVKQQTFKLKTGQNNTNTSVIITVVDRESGIANITYRIFASGLSLPLTVAYPRKRASPSNRRKRELVTPCSANDTTCYCIPQGDCFDYSQTIDIDNCAIDRYAGQFFRVQYIVYSLAGGSSIDQSLELGFLSASDIPCRPMGMTSTIGSTPSKGSDDQNISNDGTSCRPMPMSIPMNALVSSIFTIFQLRMWV